MNAFDIVFIVRYNFTNGKLKTVWRAAFQLIAQLGGNTFDVATAGCNERSDVVETLDKNTQDEEKNSIYWPTVCVVSSSMSDIAKKTDSKPLQFAKRQMSNKSS